jgi:hypothetical protein
MEYERNWVNRRFVNHQDDQLAFARGSAFMRTNVVRE